MSIADRVLDQGFSTAYPARSAGRRFADPLPASPPVGERVPRDRVRDVTALGLLAACLFLVVALATFHPADPPAA
ncbi:MAG: hypothetical protein ACK5SI_07675, partial [Planctomycetia bacterium]